MSIILAMMLQVAADPERAAIEAFRSCMIETGTAWSAGTDSADIIARAVRTKCAPQETALRNISLQRAKPEWDARQKATHREMVTDFIDAAGKGLQNSIEAMVVERRATVRR